MAKVTPIDEAIDLDSSKYIVSRTDTRGNITYGNEYFIEISGYAKAELIGSPHNIIRHPDMPKALFKMMWDRIKQGHNIMAVVKNLAKDGRYYWVITDFESKNDPKTGEILGYTAYRKVAPDKVIEKIEPIYQKLLEIEKTKSVDAAEMYLQGYLDEIGKTYDEFVDDLVENKGMFRVFFKIMKKVFS